MILVCLKEDWGKRERGRWAYLRSWKRSRTSGAAHREGGESVCACEQERERAWQQRREHVKKIEHKCERMSEQASERAGERERHWKGRGKWKPLAASLSHCASGPGLLITSALLLLYAFVFVTGFLYHCLLRSDHLEFFLVIFFL